MATAPAQRRRIPLDELARLPSFYIPLASWDREQLAFYWDRTGRIELYLMDLRSRQVRQVSHGEVPRDLKAGFVWDRAGSFIIFAKDREGDEQHELYRIELATGEVTQITRGNHTAQQYPVEISPDDRWLTVMTNRRHPETPDQPGQMNIWRMRPDGSDYQPVTRHPFPAWGGSWSPDGAWLAYNTNDDPTDLKNMDGYIVRPDGSEARRVFHVKPGSHDTVGDWHPDGRHIAVTSDASGTPRAGVLNLDTGR
ncbi:MAG: PD40 domain-containing protein, partial [Chloroflexi bacterium]|nr:PD40 domain-containing protein [Chloroflexota bacterium]